MQSSASPETAPTRPGQPAQLLAEALLLAPGAGSGTTPAALDTTFAPGSITRLTGNAPQLTAALNVLALREAPLSGRLHHGETDLLALDRTQAGLWRRQTLRLIPREPVLAPTRTALQHLQAATRDHEPQAAIPRALDMLDRFDLGRRAGSKTATLADGARQALAVATALCVMPRILLLDDVTADMGAQLAGKVIRAIHHLARKRGMIVVATSSDRVFIDNADRQLAVG